MESKVIQMMLSTFIDYRQRLHKLAGEGDMDVVPVILTSSTRAASTQTYQTRSARSKTANIHLVPMSSSQMQEILVDVLI